MANDRFDLNDIDHEPSYEALAALMEAVSQEAQRRESTALAALFNDLRRSLAEAHATESPEQ